MLLELLDVERAVAAAGIGTTTRHGDIKPLARRDVLSARLDSAAYVTRVDVVAAGDALRFWTLRDGQKNSFPLIVIGSKPTKKKPGRPLRPRGDPEKLKDLANEGLPLDKRFQAFISLCEATPLNLEGLIPWPGYRQPLTERLAQLAGAAGTKAAGVSTLLGILLATDGEGLLTTLDATVVRELQNAPTSDLFRLAANLLFLGGGEVLLDLAAPVAGARDACDPGNVAEISAALQGAKPSATLARCSLSGETGFIEDDKFPEAALPVVGRTYLFAKNVDTPCSRRYGIAGPAAFPVSRALTTRLQAAAEELACDARAGKTWSRVPSETPKKYDLLVSFVPAHLDLPLASGFCGGTGAVVIGEGSFEALAGDLIKLAKGRATAHSEIARFLIIRKVDPANHKVVFSTTNSLVALASAAERWTAGCGNVPRELIQLPVSIEKGQKPKRCGPWVIAPGGIVGLGREIFTHGGAQRSQAPGPTFADAMRLFLGGEETRCQIARRLLQLFLARRGPLVSGIAHASHQGSLKEFDAKSARSALETVSALGLLLREHPTHREKEVYMNDVAFCLGQLLAGADGLHRGYCEDQRGGSVPLALLGNQILAVAQRSPVAALSQLGGRWRVYAGWAVKRSGFQVDERLRDRKTLTSSKDRAECDRQWTIQHSVRLGRKLAPLAQQLHGRLPERADDVFRAELLLGYIAGLPRTEAASIDGAKPSNTADLELED